MPVLHVRNVPEDLHTRLKERADALFDHLSDAPPARFYVPDLFFIECTNFLWKAVRRFDYPAEVAEQDVVDLVRLPLQAVSTAALAGAALSLAVEHGSTAYVALARRMVTVDREPLGLDVSPESEEEAAAATDQQEGQVTMFDLFQRHGPQPERRRRRRTKVTSARQLSLFGSGQAASA